MSKDKDKGKDKTKVYFNNLIKQITNECADINEKLHFIRNGVYYASCTDKKLAKQLALSKQMKDENDNIWFLYNDLARLNEVEFRKTKVKRK